MERDDIPGIMHKYQKQPFHVRFPHENLVMDSLETVNIHTDYVKPIKIKLDTEPFGRIHGMFDSGASLNCINSELAERDYQPYIQKIRNFNVRTANGNIVIDQVVPMKVHRINQPPITTFFYLLKDAPHSFIISRGLYGKLGYKMIDPLGRDLFTNSSTYEEISGDLYDDIFNQMDYGDLTKITRGKRAKYADPKDFVVYIMEELQYQHHNQPKDELCIIDPQLFNMDITGRIQQDVLNKVMGQIHDNNIQQRFIQLLRENQKRYAQNQGDVGTIPNVEFEINLKPGEEDKPINSKPYPHSYKHSDEVARQIKELLRTGIIRKSKSEWASPTLMVPKPEHDGHKEWRMCVDYRGLNSKTIKDRYRIPTMKDLFRRLRGKQVFSNFDLRSGYYHVPVREEDKHKTAFITDHGLYEWNRMTFGFSNAPATFQRAMDEIFKGLDYVIVYLDDIIGASENEVDHLHHLREVFKRLNKYQLKLRLVKCRFFQRTIKYLGIFVDEHGIRCDPNYVDKILRLKRPENKKEVERFVGMVGWLAKFIPNLSKLTGNLSTLKGKSTFNWTMEHDRYFDQIRQAVAKAKILRHPDLSREFYVQTDASDGAIGAVLLQDFGRGELEPIEFASRKLTTAEQKWSTTQKELIAVVFALKKWIRYLLPKHFTIFTDHKNLEELFKYGPQKKINKIQRWIILLQQFDFTARYLPGKDNYVADYLSRDIEDIRTEMCTIAVDPEIHELYVKEQLRRSKRLKEKKRVEYNEDVIYDLVNYGKKYKKQNGVQFPYIISKEEEAESPVEARELGARLNQKTFLKEQQKDPHIQQIVKAIKTGEIGSTLSRKERKDIEEKYYIINTDKLLYYLNKEREHKVIVPQSLTRDVIQYFHEGNNFQHQGITRTKANISLWFKWSNMDRDIARYIQHCTGCSIIKYKTRKKEGHLTPIITRQPFEMISADIVGPLPITSSGNRYILTIMDHFTRYTRAIPLKEITATRVADCIIKEWINIFGPPRRILTDNGTQFANKTWNLICTIQNIKQKFTTVSHPECNGMLERYHKYLKERLKIIGNIHDLDYWDGDSWDKYISCITYSYNITVHSSTQHSPFHLLFGRKPDLPLDFQTLREIERDEIKGIIDYDDYLFQFINQLSILRGKAYEIQKTYKERVAEKVNNKKQPFSFQTGQLVMRYIGDKMVGNKKKLLPNYIGPYEIKQLLPNNNTFIIQNVKDTKEQITIHGDKLAIYKAENVKGDRNNIKENKNETSRDKENKKIANNQLSRNDTSITSKLFYLLTGRK